MAVEGAIRLGAFLGVLALLLAVERWRPWRQDRPSGTRRWPANVGLTVVSAIMLKVLLPLTAVGAAVWAADRAIGLFAWLALPGWVAIPAAFVLLDGLIYWQHRATHAVPPLWRLHRVHHADPELDVTSALRFHPIEIVASMILKIGVVIALGAPPVAVLAFEVALNAGAMFNHAAIALPPALSRALSWVLVTPEMHRIHHSERPNETDSCFGFCLPWWDWWFGTWRAAPEGALVIGVAGWRAAPEQRLHRLLWQPFTRDIPLRAGSAENEEGLQGELPPPAAAPHPVASIQPMLPSGRR